jgi:predicted nucleic acid-binding Zn ribbon protein
MDPAARGKGAWPMHCPECGAPASGDDLFCSECGAILAVAPATTSATSLPAEPLASPAPVRATRDTGASVAFILGLASVGLAVAYCIPIVGIFACVQPLVGIAAIIVGAVARRDIQARGGPEPDRRRARQGMILGMIGTGLFFALMVLSVLLGVGLGVLSEFD